MNLDQNTVHKNIFYAEGRFFVDIAESGCGSGCAYCYIKYCKENQILIEKHAFRESLESIKESNKYVQGKCGSLISLCPNTEPFKSKDSTELIITVLKEFLPLGNPIQISTKERIPTKIFEIIEEESIYEKQVFLNISTSSISKWDVIEPNAAAPKIRFENFTTAKMYNNNIIKEYNPDTVCVGINFGKSNKMDRLCDLLYKSKEIYEEVCSSQINKNIYQFTKKVIDEINVPIFHSSICIVAYVMDKQPELKIWEKTPELCTNCRDCKNIKR